MNVLTITCHNVYNFGASLQAYALQEYLIKKGCITKIIDYRPEYLSKSYSITAVQNDKYKQFPYKQLYLTAKFPGRFFSLFSRRKRRFDQFGKKFLRITPHSYSSYEDLLKENWEEGLYIVGSDQVWNSIFPNGKDPAFFLRFIPDDGRIVKASYAASFGTSGNKAFHQNSKMRDWINSLDAVSVREAQANEFLKNQSIESSYVVDPVMLIDPESWKGLANFPEKSDPYILVYDFEAKQNIGIINKLNRNGLPILSLSKTNEYIDILTAGPLEFLGFILQAKTVYTSSFHAVIFSLIFHKEFYVIPRSEDINDRVTDLLSDLGLEDRIINPSNLHEEPNLIDWTRIDELISIRRKYSEKYIEELLKLAARKGMIETNE